ncbi:MAG: hypothetical protein OXH79_07905 [Boseongicola sp.]|nr:hypothetical protein [Boseongicola sp.]
MARFVSSISTLKYLSASEIAVAGEVASDAPTIGPETPLPALIDQLANGVDHLAVRDGPDLIGRIDRPEILAAVSRDLARR